jgi:hypothetical protein
VAAATPWSQVEAEAVSGGSSTEKTPANKDGGGEGEAKVRSFLSFLQVGLRYAGASGRRLG